MFTERVKLLQGLPAPPGANDETSAWWAQVKKRLVETLGDCNAPLTHRGPVTIDRADTVTQAGPGGNTIPVQPYPYSSINPSNTDKPSETASFTAHGGDSYLNLETGDVVNGLNIYGDGANYLEQLVVGDLVVNNIAQFNGSCEGCTGGDGGGTTVVVGAEPVRFILTSPLNRASTPAYATANLLSVVNGIETIIGPVTVCSWSNQFYGDAGARGWAVLKNDSKNDNGTAGSTYHILWLDTWFMRVVLQGDLSLGGDVQVQQIVGDSDTPVGTPFTAKDWLGNRRARDGAKGVVAHFQDRPGQFLILDLQLDAEWIVVTALTDGGGASLTGELVRHARGLPPVAVGVNITVYDPDGQFTYVKQGAKLRCEWNDQMGQYQIVQATKDVLLLSDFRFNTTDKQYEYKTRTVTVWASSDESDWVAIPPMSLEEVSVMVDWQISAFDYQGKFRTIYAPKADDEGDWETLATGEEC